MEIRELYQKQKLCYLPIKVFKVKSLTNFNPDLGEFEEYRVELWANGKWRCNCMAGQMKRICRHIKQIKEEQQLKL